MNGSSDSDGDCDGAGMMLMIMVVVNPHAMVIDKFVIALSLIESQGLSHECRRDFDFRTDHEINRTKSVEDNLSPVHSRPRHTSPHQVGVILNQS